MIEPCVYCCFDSPLCVGSKAAVAAHCADSNRCKSPIPVVSRLSRGDAPSRLALSRSRRRCFSKDPDGRHACLVPLRKCETSSERDPPHVGMPITSASWSEPRPGLVLQTLRPSWRKERRCPWKRLSDLLWILQNDSCSREGADYQASAGCFFALKTSVFCSCDQIELVSIWRNPASVR
jgi:hypothetical protein